MAGFKELKVWQLGKELAIGIYKITAKDAFKSDFGLRDQIRRAAVSIPSNIAEGDERGSNKDSNRLFYIAKGSLAELQTQLIIAHETGYIDLDVFKELDERSQSLGKMLGNLIKASTVKKNQ